MSYLALTFIFISVAHATCAFPARDQLFDLRALAPETEAQDAAVIDDPDRKSADAFGASNGVPGAVIEKRYSASGDMKCPRMGGQGQITITNDTIVTSAHLFDSTLDCKSRDPIKSCRFYTRVDGVEKEYQIKKVAGTGHKCPLPKGKSKTATEDDWMILKLVESTDSKVKPYAIPMYGRHTLRSGQKVVAVAKSIDWPEGTTGLGLRQVTRHYADCDAIRVGDGKTDTNCDMSAFSSGGAMVTPGVDPVLLGIVRGERDPRTSLNGGPSLGLPRLGL